MMKRTFGRAAAWIGVALPATDAAPSVAAPALRNVRLDMSFMRMVSTSFARPRDADLGHTATAAYSAASTRPYASRPPKARTITPLSSTKYVQGTMPKPKWSNR